MMLRLGPVIGAMIFASSAALAQDATTQPQPKAADGAQQAQQGDVKPQLSDAQPDWAKVCTLDPQSKKSFCQVSRELRAENGQTLASVAIREVQGAKRAIVLAIPPGMQIQPGVRIFVDKTQIANGKFSVCMQNACFVEAELPDPQLATFRKGTLLTLQAVNPQGRGVQLPVQLAGFAKAYDGQATDPKAFAEDQKKFQEQLIERAKKAQAEQGETPAQ
jgi:invasion protein IalB